MFLRNALVPEILHQLLASHADASVGNRQCFRLGIGGDVDFQGQSRVLDVLLRGFDVTELLHGVRGIGNQLAEENFLIGVEGMDD
jgi:hypothetical protein